MTEEDANLFISDSSPVATEPPAERKPRLFVRGAKVSDDAWLHCGGPDVAEALSGLANYLQWTVQDMIRQGTDDQPFVSLELDVRMMTDAEVEALPEQ